MRTHLMLALATGLAACGGATNSATNETTAVEPAAALDPKADSADQSDWKHTFLQSTENIQVQVDYQVAFKDSGTAATYNATPVWLNVTGTNGRTLDDTSEIRAVLGTRMEENGTVDTSVNGNDTAQQQLNLRYADSGRYTQLVEFPLLLSSSDESGGQSYGCVLSLLVDNVWQDFTLSEGTSHNGPINFATH